MAEIGIENLTPQYRKEFHRIYACDDNESVLIENRKWMPRFVGRHQAAPETKTLYVQVLSCNDETLQLAREKLGIC